MKLVSDRVLKNGMRRVTVDVPAHETLVQAAETGELKALVINPDSHYLLGDPLGDVVSGHTLTEAREVCWCSLDQSWVDK